MPWRAEDDALLQRLEDETIAESLLSFLVAGTGALAPGARIHPRSGGLIALLRESPDGAKAVRAALEGDVSAIASFVLALELKDCPPKLLHHLALHHRKAAMMLEGTAPEKAADAWMRSLAAWLALVGERSYLESLTAAVVGDTRQVERVLVDALAEISQRAEASARSLAVPGYAALLALGRIDDAATMANVSSATRTIACTEASRRRNAAIEAALGAIAEELDEAGSRADLSPTGTTRSFHRIVPIWTWASNDEAVEHFVVDRVAAFGWELHRASNWDALRELLDPLRPMFDSLAGRIERDRTQIAYAAGCAQMFVFLAEIARTRDQKRELAERSVAICPTHRNGRLVLASILCEDAIEEMREIVMFTSKSKVDRVGAMLARVTTLYPETSGLPEAQGMLERVKKGLIIL